MNQSLQSVLHRPWLSQEWLSFSVLADHTFFGSTTVTRHSTPSNQRFLTEEE